eukprot:TRINITY_DN9744_c0_g1_i3.p1 TRINITY_DN9744_c0_g1~~TRINITY_DN9744_c0_g1_i3.p1  ORF type:complete len:403 (+),score=58.87 TRINITY_DN9744_c0_g1_i3:2-1210(+)
MQCFPRWPAWEIFICCSSTSWLRFEYLWNSLLNPAKPWRSPPPEISDDARSKAQKFEPASLDACVVIAYHKTGVTLTSHLVGVATAGPLTKFVLLKPDEITTASDLEVVNYGRHTSLRGNIATIWPFFQGYIRAFPDTELDKFDRKRVMMHMTKPFQVEQPQLQNVVANGGGLLLHVVRRPSEMVASGYLYHRREKEFEAWAGYKDPPNCLSCDHEAWSLIFKGCGFRCSYHERLTNTTESEGLQLEVLRSRWDVLKMLSNARSWHENPRVLQISLNSFFVDFNATVLCIARFFTQSPPPQELDENKVQQLLEEAQEFNPLRVSDRCGQRGDCTAEEKDSMFHMSKKEDKRRMKMLLRSLEEDWDRFLNPADALIDNVVVSNAAADTFGCPNPHIVLQNLRV